MKIEVLAWNPKNVKQFLTENGKWSQENFPEPWKKVLQTVCVSYTWWLISKGSLCLHTYRDKASKDLAVSHTTLSFSQLFGKFKIWAHNGIRECLGNPNIRYLLKLPVYIHCLHEKCESFSHITTRKLGWIHYHLLDHNNHK